MTIETDQLLEKGKSLYFEFKFGDAIPVFRRLLETNNPRKEIISAYLALSYLQNSQDDEAKKILENVQSKGIYSHEFYIANAVYHVKVIKDFSQSLEYIDKALSLDANSAYGYCEKGNILREKKEYKEAREVLEKAIKIDPTFPWSWDYFGRLENDLGNHQEAIQKHSRAIELNPRISRFWCDRGEAKLIIGEYDEAISDFTKAIDLYPKDKLNRAFRGFAFEQKGDYKSAMIDYNKTIELAPSYEWGWYRRGKIKHSILNDINGGLEDLNRALDLDPDYKASWLEKGKILEKLEKFQEAINAYNKSISLDPNFEDAWANRGNVHWKLGDTKAALQDYTKALGLYDEYSYVLKRRSDLYIEIGQYESAIVDRMKYYSLVDFPEKSNDHPEANDIVRSVRNHITKLTLPEFKRIDEKLIEYWECFLFWGEEDSRLITQGRSAISHQGSLGVGYLCLTDQYIRIVSIGELSEKYAKQFRAGFGARLLRAATGHFDMIRIERDDVSWKIPFKDVREGFEKDGVFHLSSTNETWQISGCFAPNRPFLHGALDLARSGNLRRTVDMGKLRVKQKVASSEEDIFEKIEKLASLKEKGILSEAEFEEKKKELLARL